MNPPPDWEMRGKMGFTIDLYVDHVNRAAGFLQKQRRFFPRIAMIIGSGLGAFLKYVYKTGEIRYADIPHFPVSSVSGHSGVLILGALDNIPVAVLAGRKHVYEGAPIEDVIFPIRVLGTLGVKILILTNAAGGLNPDFIPGDLMLISDHINLMCRNPLAGPHVKKWGPRFPDMSEPYDRELRSLARRIARERKIPLREGVYVSNLGPNYETRAETEYLKYMGADAVGMSTVPEDITARQQGIRVLGISYISNSLVLKPEAKTTHEEVLANARLVEEKFCTFMTHLVHAMAKDLSKEGGYKL